MAHCGGVPVHDDLFPPSIGTVSIAIVSIPTVCIRTVTIIPITIRVAVAIRTVVGAMSDDDTGRSRREATGEERAGGE